MSERDEAPALDGDGPRPSGKLGLVLRIAAALAVVVLLALPAYSTLQLGYYHRYPTLRGRMSNWRGSTHALVSCRDCHVDPGSRGTFGFWAKSIPAFYSQVLQGPKATNILGVPQAKACQKCHTTYRSVSASGDLLVPHRAHVEVVGADCAVCHEDLVHSANTRGFNQPEMSTCLEKCHNGIHAGEKTCNKCHTRKQVPKSHRQKDFLQIHGTLAKKIDCGECHGWSPDYCKKCHAKRPKSHAGNWKKAHGARANDLGSKGCLVCHEGGAKFCEECHD